MELVPSWKNCFSIIFNPTPSVERADTSLRYTDILFGFVIRELFLRLQNWPDIPNIVFAHLVVSTILVLGSWIGFRRSLNRSSYQVKFFNLPFMRFLADQLMLILYFRIATLTPVGANVVTPNLLATKTLLTLLCVFVLYTVWDLLGIWESCSKNEAGRPRYGLVKGKERTDEWQEPNWAGAAITFVFLVAFSLLWLVSAHVDPFWLFFVIGALLFLYRWTKDARTTWQLSKSEAAG